MAKTIFAALQQIPSAWLNKVFNHRHDGLDADGSAPIDYAADTGGANAYAVALTPALAANIAGLLVRFKAVNVNTGASTLNINGLGAVAIKKNGSQALAAGDIQAGQIVTVVYDGVNYQLLNSGQTVDSSQFGYSFATNGYQRLPGGLIIQWGVISIVSGSLAFTFPIAFPNACRAVNALPINGSGATFCRVHVAAMTTTGTTMYIDSAAATMSWIAMGN